jgi:integrating conjugative element protein (TIGR03756 family)
MKKLLLIIITPLLIGLSEVALSFSDPALRGNLECITCHAGKDHNYNGVMSTSDIVTGTMSAAMSCLNLEARGICVWMTCIYAACEFDYSVKVKNFVPELTIQSYHRAKGEPWTESQNINQISQGDADSSWVITIINAIAKFNVGDLGIRGGVSTKGKKDKEANLYFKLVDAYGNPAISAFNQLASSTGGYVCQGSTTMLFPYFISNLDSVSWRWNVPEMVYPQSLLPLITTWDLGNGGINIGGMQLKKNNYGAIYPRHGFMTSEDPLKASVLSAFRAAHFITRSGEPHIYFSIDEDAKQGYWPPNPLNQDDKDTGQWQMLYPDKEDSCRSFPYGETEPARKRSTDGSYIWNFWRAFKCCERKGAILIFHSG